MKPVQRRRDEVKHTETAHCFPGGEIHFDARSETSLTPQTRPVLIPSCVFPPQTNGRLSRRQRDRSSDILFISVSENIMKVWHRFYNDALFIPLFWFLSA